MYGVCYNIYEMKKGSINMKKPIDWEQVDAEFDEYLKKEQFINEQIAKEREKVKSVEELTTDAQNVNLIIEKNNFKSKLLTPKKGNKE